MLIVEDQNIEENKDFKIKKPNSKPQKNSCLKAFGCFILFLFIITVLIYGGIKFLLGPAISKIDNLPNDFPKELVLANIDKAKIKIQTPEDKEKLQSILNYLPPSINDFLNKNLILNHSTSASSSVDTQKSVSVSWTDINRKKEELLEFYKKQFLSKGYKIKETIDNNNINLDFWKDGASGELKINENETENSSDAKLIINY